MPGGGDLGKEEEFVHFGFVGGSWGFCFCDWGRGESILIGHEILSGEKEETVMVS